MKIKFACPNGHPLSATPDRAGKPGTCPKCSSRFLVPEPDEDDLAGESHADEDSSVETRPRKDVIAFLCPNGHKLHGPSRLQGKAGQCPHCGMKFRIPDYDEDEDVEEFDDIEEIDDADDVDEVEEIEEIDEVEDAPAVADSSAGSGRLEISAPGSSADLTLPPAEDEEIEEVDEDDVEEVAPPAPTAPPAGSVIAPATGISNGHALASIFLRFWSQRDAENVVEIHLQDGEMIEPEWFSSQLSSQGFGVFAVEEKDGTFTVTTIPWEAVARVGFRKVKQLPAGLFE